MIKVEIYKGFHFFVRHLAWKKLSNWHYHKSYERGMIVPVIHDNRKFAEHTFYYFQIV